MDIAAVLLKKPFGDLNFLRNKVGARLFGAPEKECLAPREAGLYCHLL
jgi:hypothetical protein